MKNKQKKEKKHKNNKILKEEKSAKMCNMNTKHHLNNLMDKLHLVSS